MGTRHFAISPVGVPYEERVVFWRGVVQEWTASGLSAERFGRSRGMSPSSVLRWAQILGVTTPRARRPSGEGDGREGDRLGDTTVARRPNPFVPVRIVEAPPANPDRKAGAVEVVLGGKRRIALAGDFDAKVLQRAVLTLEALPC